MFGSDLDKFLAKNRHTKIVFTNGCFDILHRGHVEYLKDAKSLGTILVVGLNSDASVKKLKGPERPINSEQDRKIVLENLRSVDFVQIFHEDTPLELIKYIRPNVLVKGGDWSVDKIVGSDFVLASGGDVKSLKFVNGFSTTNIISRIKVD
ncbi:MAG: D-glycero-beta-D-manno-heptose 1-phosphate adenylyltransferase [Bdellovibrio sp.]|nr:D-glycero-beta-D-manno-heptose 1-phosphate adenylyltransferase [Bdellovibrio sp.]